MSDEIDKAKNLEEAKEIFKQVMAIKQGMPTEIVEKGHALYGYKAGTRMVYYKEPYAIELRFTLDDMMKDEKPRFVRASEYGLRPASLLARVTQGAKYLIDNLDTPEKKYLKFWNNVTCRLRRDHPQGVIIEVKEKSQVQGLRVEFAEDLELDKKAKGEWKNEMIEFIKNATPGQRCFITELSLTSMEIEEAKGILNMAPEVVYKINTDAIVMAKTQQKDI